MFQKILLPLDGSLFAEKAIPIACELADKFEGEVTLLRVVSPPTMMAYSDGIAAATILTGLREQRMDEANDYLAKQQAKLTEQGYRIKCKTGIHESPAEQVLHEVVAEKHDTIVMSTHGRGRAARWVFGSVANRILRHCDIPIVLIRISKTELAIELPKIASEADMRSHEPA